MLFLFSITFAVFLNCYFRSSLKCVYSRLFSMIKRCWIYNDSRFYLYFNQYFYPYFQWKIKIQKPLTNIQLLSSIEYLIFKYMHQLMTKVIFSFILYVSWFRFWSVNNTSINKNSQLNIFGMVNIVGEISNKERIGLRQMYTFESFLRISDRNFTEDY